MLVILRKKFYSLIKNIYKAFSENIILLVHVVKNASVYTSYWSATYRHESLLNPYKNIKTKNNNTFN